MKHFYTVLIAVLLLSSSMHSQQSCPGNWLTVDGNRLLDSNGTEVILAGVNWFGFETQISIPHGLYARDIEGMLEQTKDLGFNCLRIPWHNGMLRDGATFQAPNYWVKDPFSYDGTPEVGPFSNLGLQGMTKPIEIMDYLVQWCQDNDMKVILDCHSRNADGYLQEKLWYTDNVSEQQWIDDWVFITERYKNFDAVIGMDINNEPNGKIDNPNGARWGNDDPATDWRLAAEKCGNAILKANPNVLIMVEGIEAYNKPDGTPTSYWWGGNLQGARDFPVRLDIPSKLMYSPHEYGPTVFDQVWFSAPDFPDNMPAIWEEQFNFLNTEGTSPLLIGELGIKGQGGKDEIWFQKFIDFIKEKKLHFTFWALNPNSGDTGGILANDWSTVVQWKMDYLQPILSNPIPNCSGSVLSVTDFDSLNNDIVISPNPTSDILQFNSENNSITSIRIFDINGRKIDYIDTSSSLTNSYAYNASKLASGLYMTQITTATKKTITKKFSKK
ncbi:glycoside hydrolase family 5 protein [Aquimarina sp. RZ0]|uniref:glycoside hydrolase family 5 protein n=1 Tax=Aquimarina sp. RZ0 TaxID=2607730 RepID=UPI0011F35510|nr:glycoside hydrolase family 5 protein [Aquimarina sp. RZ0]KAA1246197.1 cellulase family glycosylhydrolase [Aquimarina sp. RZ0]